MFGVLDLNSCGIAKEKRSFYSCNVCNALASKFGRTSRVMLTNDSVYLSLLIAAQRNHIPYRDFTRYDRCRPWSRRSLCLPDFEFPAAVSVLIGGVRLVDHKHDVASFQSKVLFALWRSRVREAEEKLGELGLSLPPISDLVKEQHRREAVIGRELGYYSRTTEEIYSKIFSHTATLAGAQTNSNLLAEVGLQVGRIAYLLDNYVDFQNDKSRGAFNLFNHLSLIDPENRAAGSSRQFLEDHVNEGLQRIQESMLKVRLNRLQTTIRYVVTDGLRLKVSKAVASGGSLVPRAALYSAAPAIATVMLTTSSSGECCNCSDFCTDVCASSEKECIDRALANIATRTGEGLVAAGIAAAASTLLSGLVPHLRAPTPHPAEEPSPRSTEEPRPPESPSEEPAQAPSETPPETTPEKPPDEGGPKEQTQEPPRTTLTHDQIHDTVFDGLFRNRDPEDIMADLRDLNWVSGGSGDVDLTRQGGPLVRVRTQSGEQITAFQDEANNYNEGLKEVNQINRRSAQIRDEMTSLEREAETWKYVETNLSSQGMRWIAGTAQLMDAHRDYQNSLSQIDERHHKPSSMDPDLPVFESKTEYQRRLREWEQRPEVIAERNQARTEYDQRLDRLTSGRYVPSEPSTYTQGTIGPDGEPQAPRGPLSEESAFTRPAVHLNRIAQQQDSYIKELKQLEIEKQRPLEKMEPVTTRLGALKQSGGRIPRRRWDFTETDTTGEAFRVEK